MIKVYNMDVRKGLKMLEDESIDMCITSPPYFNQRDYGIEGQIGLEKKPEEYIDNLCSIFDLLRNKLKNHGSLWINLGDCYGGFQGKNSGYPDRKNERASIPQIKRDNNFSKCLLCIPERFALEMIRRKWTLRNKIIWHKCNVMPSSAKDRFTIDYEMIFFFTKQKKYYFETQYEPLADSSLRDPRLDKGRQEHAGKCTEKIYSMNATSINSIGRNKRCVWKINTKPFKESHFAVFPEELCITPIKAGCPEFVCNKCGKAREKVMSPRELKLARYTSCLCNSGFSGGIVLDPFVGSGTTLKVARDLGRNSIGIEINPNYVKLIEKRLFGGNKPLINDFEIIK